MSDTGGTTTSQVHYFTTAALQPVSLGNDTTICNTCSLNLRAGSGYSTYLWQDGSTMMNYSATSAGTYHVQVMDSAGCVYSDSITIGVFPFVNVESGYESLIAIPNPVEAELCLTGDFLKIKTEMAIRITDLSGRTVYHSNIFKKNIDNRIMIATKDFHPGLTRSRKAARKSGKSNTDEVSAEACPRQRGTHWQFSPL